MKITEKYRIPGLMSRPRCDDVNDDQEANGGETRRDEYILYRTILNDVI